MIPKKIFYGRRKGRGLNARKTHLLQDACSTFQIDELVKFTTLADYHVHLTGQYFDKYHLEIGFGYGEHLMAQALKHQNIGFLGCEVFVNGVASLLEMIQEHPHLNNIIIYPEPIQNLIHVLSSNSFSRIFILFPDPWHKARHAKRRLFNQVFLDQLLRILTTDGQIVFASDDCVYVEEVLTVLQQHEKHVRYQYLDVQPATWPVTTRYEDKALSQGKICYYISINRR